MSQKIDVAEVAEQARIALTPEEKDTFQRQLESIVSYVEKIGELGLDGIEPTLHGNPRINVFRDDVVVPSAGRDCFLNNAPERNNAEIRLPKIVEDA